MSAIQLTTDTIVGTNVIPLSFAVKIKSCTGFQSPHMRIMKTSQWEVKLTKLKIHLEINFKTSLEYIEWLYSLNHYKFDGVTHIIHISFIPDDRMITKK